MHWTKIHLNIFWEKIVITIIIFSSIKIVAVLFQSFGKATAITHEISKRFSAHL